MRLSMKKEQPASSTILLHDWLATEQKNNWIACVCPKNRGHFTDLAAESCILSVNPLPFPSQVNIFFVHSFYYLVHVVLTLNIVPSTKFFFPSCDSLGNHTRYITKRAKHLHPQALGWHTPIYICVAYRVEYIMITFSGISHCNLGGGGKTNSGSPLQWPSSL